MKIGIIGAGNMGRALGARWTEAGHAVMFGARRRDRAAAAAAMAGAAHGTTDEAAAHGEVLLWTIRESDPATVLAEPRLLDGKVVVDLNNRDYATEVARGAPIVAAIAAGLRAAAPRARVVKAFNTIAMESFGAAPATLRAAGAQTFLAGDDADAKATVARLAADLGFEAVDLGGGAAGFLQAEALGDAIRLLMIEGGRGWRAAFRVHLLPEPEPQPWLARQPSSYR
jgi:predicted dinucleotide-binding enzyme